jgi:hypothetical protein
VTTAEAAKKPATERQMLHGIRNKRIDAAADAGGMVCVGFGFTTRPEDRAKIIAAVSLGEWLLVPAGHVVSVSVNVKAPKSTRKRGAR